MRIQINIWKNKMRRLRKPRIILGIRGFRKWVYRPRYSLNKTLFEFNPYDDDDHPSVPHGDEVGTHHFKLDLKDGTVYEGRKRVGKLKKKEFERLKADSRIREVIIEAQEYYAKHHPGIQFDPISWMNEKSKFCSVCNNKRPKNQPHIIRTELTWYRNRGQ